jgi:hypothetical protein
MPRQAIVEGWPRPMQIVIGLAAASLCVAVAACSSGRPPAPLTAPIPTMVPATAPAIVRLSAGTAPAAGARPAAARASDAVADADEPPPGAGPLAPSAGRPPDGAPAWSDEIAVELLRAALQRRGQPSEVVDGVMVPTAFDPTRAVVNGDDGRWETLADGGAWRIATYAGAFWVFDSGFVFPAAEAAGR